MKITNKQNLPQAFVNAVSHERHNQKGCYSATTLLHGFCETILTERHYDELEVDAADSIWTIFGTAVHSVFEVQKDDTFKEEFFKVPVSNSFVTGRLDCYDMEKEQVIDWKTASAWKVVYRDFDDWKKQGLIYAWLLKKNNLTVRSCRFVALLKDFSRSKASQNPSTYPQSPVYVYEFAVTDKDLAEIEKWIQSRVESLEALENVPSSQLPQCSNEERWADPPTFAVKKEGRKTALKVCSSREEAEKYLTEKGGDFIEERKGESKKCVDYCICRNFCPYYSNRA